MADYVCVTDFEKRARPLITLPVASYFYAGSDEEITLRENVLALQRIKLLPRVLRDVSHRNLTTTLLGERIVMPIAIAPSGFHKLACPDGEVSTSKAGQAKKTCYVVSSGASCTFEEICGPCPDSLKWFQLYILRDRERNVRFVRQAEALGFKALVLTVDRGMAGHRREGMRNPMTLPQHVRAAFGPEKGGMHGSPWGADMDNSITWKDIQWLKSITNMAIVVKGVMTPEDAILAVEHGVSAVWVSNHGGRQLDTVPATIDVLAGIVAAVGDKLEVYMDGGIRTGTDVLKALALGARAVFIGRPVVWGLACKGQEGVEQVLDILTEELSTAMALTGCTSLDDINSSLILRSRESKL